MRQDDMKNLRNIGIIAHIDAVLPSFVRRDRSHRRNGR